MRLPWRRDPAAGLGPGPLRDLLVTGPPARACPLEELPLLAVDLETTGLDPGRDRVLAAGWVPVDGTSVSLSGAQGRRVRPDREVGASAGVHGLTDDALADAAPLEEVLDELLLALRGRVLLAHGADIETGFVAAACVRLHGVRPRLAAVDTMRLHRKVLGLAPGDPGGDRLRLDAARRRFGLPRYRAHDALTDALGCAELYLAQADRIAAGRRLTLADLLAPAA